MQVQFTVEGQPKGKARPRFGKGHTYTPPETKAYEELIANTYKKETNYKFNGEIKVVINAYYKIPENKPKKEKILMVTNEVRPQSKPDIDNICKGVLDALNKIAYDDDKQVVSLEIQKWYSETPRLEIQIFNIKE